MLTRSSINMNHEFMTGKWFHNHCKTEVKLVARLSRAHDLHFIVRCVLIPCTFTVKTCICSECVHFLFFKKSALFMYPMTGTIFLSKRGKDRIRCKRIQAFFVWVFIQYYPLALSHHCSRGITSFTLVKC